jgi:hypothetical protein
MLPCRQCAIDCLTQLVGLQACGFIYMYSELLDCILQTTKPLSSLIIKALLTDDGANSPFETFFNVASHESMDNSCPFYLKRSTDSSSKDEGPDAHSKPDDRRDPACDRECVWVGWPQ